MPSLLLLSLTQSRQCIIYSTKAQGKDGVATLSTDNARITYDETKAAFLIAEPRPAFPEVCTDKVKGRLQNVLQVCLNTQT